MESQEVVAIQTCARGGCVVVEASMAAMEVVVVQPWVELSVAFL